MIYYKSKVKMLKINKLNKKQNNNYNNFKLVEKKI